MAFIEVNGTTLYYEDTGPAPELPGETIVFSHGLLMNTALFAPQVAAFRQRYRCIAYDHRSQGRSAAATEPVVTMDQVAEDAAALIEKLGVAPVHFCGLSMGGFTGMRLAARRPELLRSVLLLDTSAEAEPADNVPRYRLLNFVARWLSFRLVLSQVLPIMFGQSFLKNPARAEDRRAARAMLSANPAQIWRAIAGVIERPGIEAELARIALPTLVLVGEEDVATVPAKAERLAAGIAGAKLVRIPRAGHSSTIEEPAAVNQALADFLDTVPRS
jgi:3-oxoadipate enol-lactonase